MNRKKHINRKKYAFAIASAEEKNKKIDYNLSCAMGGVIIALIAGFLIGLGLLYRSFQKLPVYQKGVVVNMRMLEKSEPFGKHNRQCRIKLYYDGRIYTESVRVYQYSDYAIGDDVPRKFLKGNPIILEPNDTLVDGFFLSIFFILLYGGILSFGTWVWYKERRQTLP